MNDGRSVLRWLAAIATIGIALAWLEQLGHGALAPPPLSIADLPRWLDQRDTALAAFALVRMLALGFGVYLLAVTSVGGVARVLHLTRIAAAIDRVTLPFARTLFGGVALLGVIGAPQSLPTRAHDVMVELPSDSSSSTSQATLRLLPDEPQSAPELPGPLATTGSPAPAPPPVSPPDERDTWVVQHGDSFWVIAQAHLDDVRGHPVDQREVDAYWRQLVEVNRSRLVNGNEDLLFTGQVLDLPAVVG